MYPQVNPQTADVNKRYNQQLLEQLPGVVSFLTGRTQVLAVSDRAKQGTHTEKRWYPSGKEYVYTYTPQELERTLATCRTCYTGIKQAIKDGNGRKGKELAVKWAKTLYRWGWVSGLYPSVEFSEFYVRKARAYTSRGVTCVLKPYKAPSKPHWVTELEQGVGDG